MSPRMIDKWVQFAEERISSPTSRSSTPKNAPYHLSSRPATPLNDTTPPRQETFNTSLHPLHPAHPITTPQQFYDWFAIVEKTISHSQEAHFRNHLETVEEHLGRCEVMRDRVAEVLDLVQAMICDWKNVEEGAESLQAACERQLEERVSALSSRNPASVFSDKCRTASSELQMKFHCAWNTMRNLNMPLECSTIQGMRLCCSQISSLWLSA